MASSPRRPLPAAATAGALPAHLDPFETLDRLLPAVLGRTAGEITVGPASAARRAIRFRLARLGRRRRLRQSLGTSTLAAGLVAGGAQEVWSRLSSASAPAAAPEGTAASETPSAPEVPAPAPVLPPAPGAPDAPVAPSPSSWTWDPAAGIDRVAADPGALHADGTWHVFTTSATHCTAGACTFYRVPRFTSADLAQPGRLAGDALPDLPAWVDPDRPEIWAPAAARVGDGYVLWFSATARTDLDRTAGDGRIKCLGAAVASRPEGPFVPLPQPLRCAPGYWAIDPYPVEADGRRYLLWREDDAAHPTGRIVAAGLSADGLAFADPDAQPTTLLAGEQPWEDSTPGPGIGPIENPALARHPATGEWLLTWSANSWGTQAYATGLARCAGPVGPCDRLSDATPWHRTHADLASGSAPFGGAGGLTFAPGPDGQLYALFHAYPGLGEHPGAVRAGWVARVDADPGGAPDRPYRLVPIGGNHPGDPSVMGV